MLNFLSTVAASAVGFVIAKFATAWFDAHVSKASYLEAERNQDSEIVRETIADISLKAMDYWSRDHQPTDQIEEAKITAGIRRVAILIDELFEHDRALHGACSIELDRFEDKVTVGDFGSAKRKAESQRTQDILLAAETVSSKVKQSRRKLKPKWFGNGA
ncbi:hypothetical protein ABLN87_04395 [Ruegeria sp. SCPT10]|uniref:hypothetical protein n=1 Tax=Ruegeria sp. SCP10 TaxID=3141377 RepID=UPI003334EFED